MFVGVEASDWNGPAPVQVIDCWVLVMGEWGSAEKGWVGSRTVTLPHSVKP